MGKSLAVEVAFAAVGLTRVAVTPELEVYQPVVTLADSRRELCPSTGGTGVRAFMWHGSDLSAQYGTSAQYGASAQRGLDRSTMPAGGITAGNCAPKAVFSGIASTSISKPRPGYCALSGTG